MRSSSGEETWGGQTQIPLSILATPLKKQALTREQKAVIPFRYQSNLDLCSYCSGKCRQRRDSPKNTEPNPTKNDGCTLVHPERLSASRPQSWNCKADHRKACNFIREAFTPPSKHSSHPTHRGSPSLQIKKEDTCKLICTADIAEYKRSNVKIPHDNHCVGATAHNTMSRMDVFALKQFINEVY